jgi:hypothetical protein
MSVAAATIRAVPGDLERLPAAAPGAGPAAAEMLGRVRAELPAVGRLGEREQVLGVGVADRAAVGAHLPRLPVTSL